MTAAQLLAFNVVLVAAIASPGPALLIAAQTSLSAGRRAGIAVGAGLGLMAAAWTLMALLGLGVVFEAFPVLYAGAKITGGTYLLYLAFRLWREEVTSLRLRPKPARHAFRRGFLTNLFNPKSVLFAAAVLVAVFPARLDFADSVIVVANHFVVEIAFYSVLSFCLTTETVASRYIRARIWIDRIAAAMLGALGLRLLFSRETVSPVTAD